MTSENLPKRKRLVIHPFVFGCSAGLIILFVLFTLTNLDTAEAVFTTVKDGITETFGWFLILCVQGFLLFCIYLAFSRFGHIRVGGPGARPSYNRPAWFSMLFSAGMGIGLMFWSVAEPITHFENPPVASGMDGDAAMRAMDLTFLHWGFHAWAIYAMVGLALAYFCFNRGLPLTVRSVFYPLIGERIHGPVGNVIDTIAVVATLFGVATSLGFGVAQINAGLHLLFDVSVSPVVQMALIAIITAVATASVVSGLDKGIKRLSQFNLVAAVTLMLFLVLVGPSLFLFKGFVQNTGHYLQNLLTLGSWTEAYARDANWQGNWTVFYWSWWIAWSPFVGMFIARISYGRTVREFILGVLVVPSVLTFVWISIFGGAAIYETLYVDTQIVEAVNANMATALFELLARYPAAAITSLLAMLLVFVFFVTSSDSGSLVIDIITSGGNLNPPVAQRVFWAVSEGVVAAVLTVGGGLTALQTASITTGLPFAIILVIMAWGLLKAFREEMPALSHRAARAHYDRDYDPDADDVDRSREPKR
ncbi:MAG: BCCT family transporter [Woeseiaceae bacterium]|nr:BCCT family transporter [Woeseiaceae bacterium]